MSELKVYHHELRHNEYEEFYLKYEADKVIEEKDADYKEACGRLQTANLIKDEQLAAARHHKYTRCLDNAWWCKKLSHVYALSAYTHRGWKIARYYDEKAELYRKWNTRWLKIAEQFKDKEATNGNSKRAD